MNASTSKTMNISLPPELHRVVKDHVASGMYTSASELVREALRLLERTLTGQRAAEPTSLTAEQWREMRGALLDGQAELFRERAREVGALFVAGLQMKRAQLRREMPDATEAVRNKHLAQWMEDRSARSTQSPYERPVSAERRRRILGG